METLSDMGLNAVTYLTEKAEFDIGPYGRALVKGLVATAGAVRLVYVTSTNAGEVVVKIVSGAMCAVTPTLPLVMTGLYLGFSHVYKESRERNSYNFRCKAHKEERRRQDKLRHERRIRLMKEKKFSEHAINEEHKRYEEEKYGLGMYC